MNMYTKSLGRDYTEKPTLNFLIPTPLNLSLVFFENLASWIERERNSVTGGQHHVSYDSEKNPDIRETEVPLENSGILGEDV